MKPSSAILPFGDYFAAYFSNRYPQISAMLRPDRTIFTANLYLFRYDSRLSPCFVRNHIDSFSRSIAEVSGKSIPEARRLLALSVRDAARAYFSKRWDQLSTYVRANAPALAHLRLQNTKIDDIHEKLDTSSQIPDVDPVVLRSLFEHNVPVLVFVYADYCSLCKIIRPIFEEMARALGSSVICVGLNGPKAPDFKYQYNIATYPALLRFSNFAKCTIFPKRQLEITVPNLIAFAKGLEFQSDASQMAPLIEEELELTSPRRTRSQWQSMLKRQGIDLLDALVSERSEVLLSKIDRAIHCGGTSCDVVPYRPRSPSNGDPPPLCVLLGGGMGAGKSTVVGLISETKFWKQHGSKAVVVEADAFKMSDPLFQVLQSVTPQASRIVHKDSMEAAEHLFLQAVNMRRDVVFDGTLSWCEYARQTIEMLRDTEYFYERGPGYVETNGGGVSEIYWVRAGKRSEPVEPYRIELVGVTADAEISVMRGFIRKMTTGRGIPVQGQLKSHALFSQHFETYIDLVDSAYLFDTTLNSDGEKDVLTYGDQLVAIKPGLLFKNPNNVVYSTRSVRGFAVRNADAYERFLRKKFLNIAARGLDELYESSVFSLHRENRNLDGEKLGGFIRHH